MIFQEDEDEDEGEGEGEGEDEGEDEDEDEEEEDDDYDEEEEDYDEEGKTCAQAICYEMPNTRTQWLEIVPNITISYLQQRTRGSDMTLHHINNSQKSNSPTTVGNFNVSYYKCNILLDIKFNHAF